MRDPEGTSISSDLTGAAPAVRAGQSTPAVLRDDLSASSVPVDDKRTALNEAMERYVKGENSAFRLVYRLLAPRMNTLLRERGCNAPLAEDLLQQAFLRIHRGRALYSPGRDAAPWVLTITRRLLIDHRRQRRKEDCGHHDLQVALELADPERQAIAAQAALRLQRQIERLPAGQRRAFELVRVRGFSLAQAAQSLGTTTLGVKLRLHRACQSLRERASADERACS